MLTCLLSRGVSPFPEHIPAAAEALRALPGAAAAADEQELGELPAEFQSLTSELQTHQPQPQAMAAAAGRTEHLSFGFF